MIYLESTLSHGALSQRASTKATQTYKTRVDKKQKKEHTQPSLYVQMCLSQHILTQRYVLMNIY